MNLLRQLGCLSVAGLLSFAATPSAAQQPPEDDTATPAKPSDAPPSEEDKEKARRRYSRGLELYAEGAYEQAIIEFQRAHELAPSYRIFRSVGLAYQKQGDYASALRALERFLSEGGQEVSPTERAEVQKDIAYFRERTALVEVVVNVPGAEIFVNGTLVGVSPLREPLLINTGKHQLSASLGGRRSPTKLVTLAGADKTRVELSVPAEDFVSQPAVAPPTTPSREGDRRPQGSPSPATTKSSPSSSIWLGVATTGVFAAGAAVTGVLALSYASDLERMRSDSASVPLGGAAALREDLDAAQSRTRTMAILSDVLLGATVVAGSITLVVALSGGSSGKTSDAAARRTVRVGLNPGGLRLATDL